MSNVEYRCPHTNADGLRDCGNRHFGIPGGTKIQCRHHQVAYVQTEEGVGPDFLFVDADGKTKSKDQILTDQEGMRIAIAREGETKGEVTEIPATPDQLILRGVYQTLTGEKPDLRWASPRLQDEISDWKVKNMGEVNTGDDKSDDELEEDSGSGGEVVDNIPDDGDDNGDAA